MALVFDADRWVSVKQPATLFEEEANPFFTVYELTADASGAADAVEYIVWIHCMGCRERPHQLKAADARKIARNNFFLRWTSSRFTAVARFIPFFLSRPSP